MVKDSSSVRHDTVPFLSGISLPSDHSSPAVVPVYTESRFFDFCPDRSHPRLKAK
jgi:hypothetical protein